MSKNNTATQPLDPRVKRGIILFNQKKYFEAHEELELAWRDEVGDIRNFYRGILQIGVAFYHIEHKNYSGAIKLFQRAQKWLSPYSGIILGINISKLKSEAVLIQRMIEQRGNTPDGLSQTIIFPKIETNF